MTDVSMNSAPAAGWYPDPDVTAGRQMRWWSGAEWTDRIDPPAPALAHPPTGEPVALTPNSAPRWGTVWVWLVALLPWVSMGTALASLYLLQWPDASAWPVVLLLGGPYLLMVLAAILDARQLRSWHYQAVPSWAWAIPGGAFYLVVRFIRLRPRARLSSAPMWVALIAAILVVLLGLAALVGGAVLLVLWAQSFGVR